VEEVEEVEEASKSMKYVGDGQDVSMKLVVLATYFSTFPLLHFSTSST
jgi:hypothetical protein